MRPFKAVRFSRNSKSGLIRNIINAGIRLAYEKVRSIFPYDKGDRGRSAEPASSRRWRTCRRWSLRARRFAKQP